MTRETYHLPAYFLGDNKATTRSTDRYVREWRKLARPIEHALGVRLFSFDPGLTFTVPDERELIHLSVPMAARLRDALA